MIKNRSVIWWLLLCCAVVCSAVLLFGRISVEEGWHDICAAMRPSASWSSSIAP